MYTSYEETVIRGLIEMYPDLEDSLQRIIDRLFDLHPVVKEHYYHPDMLGSWSIKAVLPTIGADVDYSILDEVRDGEAAQAAYLEAIHEDTPPERRESLREALLAYCRLDTLALVKLTEYFSRAS
jgi:predicted RecB family nuclease